MEKQSISPDVIIVGGGLAGLGAASYLARAGRRVILFEKSTRLGGRAASQNYDGYDFNRGIHALYTGGAASEVLQELGVTYHYGIPKDTFFLHRGQLYPNITGLSSLLTNRLLTVGDKIELARFFSALPRLNARNLAHVSVQEWLDGRIKRPRVRQILNSTACVLVYSTALDLVSAEVLVTKLQLALKHPVHYVAGGWQTLIEGLRSVAQQAGARIVTGSRVDSVAYQEGRVQGVRLSDGSWLSAANVILAITPQEAVKLVDEGAYEPLRKIVEPLVPARVACLDVALRRLPDPRYPVVQDLDRPRFMSAQSVYTRVTPEGGALISTFKQLDPRHSGDPRLDERDLEDLLDAAQPGWRDVLVKRVFLPHIEAIGMLPTASGGGYAGRPGPLVPGIANLYLAGDWIGAGFLSDASLGSARQVAHLILQKSEAARSSEVAVSL
ncbi:MAG TPA: NAD(P)/FAD-dependent oxidoreductase [Ktedonobacteraceae bacterium]|nr:NAD(P)/FAD-dependent oxidoreductase [Ktedonobacteraceae bacterium]